MAIDATKQILPGQPLDGGTVVASVYLNDTDYSEPLVMVLLLMPEPPFYRIADVWENSRAIENRREHPNIVPAVEDYENSGGDY